MPVTRNKAGGVEPEINQVITPMLDLAFLVALARHAKMRLK